MKGKRKLPTGVCFTYFFQPEHRAEKLPRNARPCFYAYAGGKANYRAKRFMIDLLGESEALRLAMAHRRRLVREQAARSNHGRKVRPIG